MTTNKIETTTHNPLELIREHFGDLNISHIRYTPGLQSKDVMRRESVHDGTLEFSWQLLVEALQPFVVIWPQPKWSWIESGQYELGDVRVDVEIIPGGIDHTRSGSCQRETVTIPYRRHITWKPDDGNDHGLHTFSTEYQP